MKYIKNLWFMLVFLWEGGLAYQEKEHWHCKRCKARNKRRSDKKRKRRAIKEKQIEKHARSTARNRNRAVPLARFVDAELPIELVIPHVRTKGGYIRIGDENVKTSSRIFRIIKGRNSCSCAACGIEATHVRKLEADEGHFYIQAGGYDDKGEWNPMTIDHAIPTARGGTNDSSNIVLMCFTCNNTKGSQTLDEFLGIIEPPTEEGSNGQKE